jgi:Holliday junction resolvase-like predicted endonuclease
VDKKKIGEIAEKAVERAMIMKGYQFLTRNYSIHNIGELDIVFLSKHEVVIVEVRSRRESHYYPSPLDSVDRRKQNKIYRTTKYLIDRYNLYDKNISFLVGYVTLTDDHLIQNVELIPFQ